MPVDSQGRFHNSTQRMMAADRGGKSKEPPMQEPKGEPGDGGAKSHTIHDHGDGTFHSVSHDGEQTEHPHLGHAAAHFMAKHGEQGHKHLTAHHDGMGITTHQAESGGQVEGPDEHPDAQAAGEHMNAFMGSGAGY